MENKAIQSLIKKLNQEIKHIKPVTEDDIFYLLELENNIEMLIKGDQEEDLEADPASFSFREAAMHFQQSYPDAAAALNQVSDSLGESGF